MLKVSGLPCKSQRVSESGDTKAIRRSDRQSTATETADGSKTIVASAIQT
jgi:hypothetical protein